MASPFKIYLVVLGYLILKPRQSTDTRWWFRRKADMFMLSHTPEYLGQTPQKWWKMTNPMGPLHISVQTANKRCLTWQTYKGCKPQRHNVIVVEADRQTVNYQTTQGSQNMSLCANQLFIHGFVPCSPFLMLFNIPRSFIIQRVDFKN